MEEFEALFKKYKILVYAVGLLAIVGGNTTNIIGILRPDSVRVVTLDELKELLTVHDRDTMINTEHMIEAEAELILDHVDALFSECKQTHREDSKVLKNIEIQLGINKTKIDQCLERTLYNNRRY